MPVPAPTAVSEKGYCYRGDSTVTVLKSMKLHTTEMKAVKDLKVNDIPRHGYSESARFYITNSHSFGALLVRLATRYFCNKQFLEEARV